MVSVPASCDGVAAPKAEASTKGLPEGVPPLTSIYFYPTERCNLHCPHCWVDPEWVRTPEEYKEKFSGENAEIAPETFRRVLQEAKPLGLQRVKFTGGEPFLRWDLEQFFYVCRDERIAFDIETNGTLIDDERAKVLKECGCFHTAVSLDSSTPDFHDRFRGVKGAWERAVRGIDHLKRHGHNIQVIQSLCRDNENEIEPLVKLAKEMGVGSVKINPVTPGGRGKEYAGKKGLDVETLIKKLPYCENELTNRHGIPVIFSLPMAFHSFEAIANNRIGRCNILNIIGLLSDGSISICGIGRTESGLISGNVGVESLEGIWVNGSIFKEIREKLPRGLGGACRKCIFKGACLGYCIAGSFARNRDLFAGYSICEEAEERGLSSKSRKAAR